MRIVFQDTRICRDDVVTSSARFVGGVDYYKADYYTSGSVFGNRMVVTMDDFDTSIVTDSLNVMRRGCFVTRVLFFTTKLRKFSSVVDVS